MAASRPVSLSGAQRVSSRQSCGQDWPSLGRAGGEVGDRPPSGVGSGERCLPRLLVGEEMERLELGRSVQTGGLLGWR